MIKYLRLLLFAAVSVCIVNNAAARDLKGLFPSSKSESKYMAVYYFNMSSRRDLSIMAEFIRDCSKQTDVTCLCAESSDAAESEIINAFKNSDNKPYLYKGRTDKPTPRIEFIKSGAVAGAIEHNGNFSAMTIPYLNFVAGKIDDKGLAAKIKEAESAEDYKKLIPRMQFVLMLAKKGQVESALAELDKMSEANLDNKGKLLLGEAYLRLKAPEKAISILSRCDDTDCTFYLGVAEYLAGNPDKAIAVLKGIQSSYSDVNKLNYFLKKIYESKGDKKHADEIRLPENYNVNTD